MKKRVLWIVAALFSVAVVKAMMPVYTSNLATEVNLSVNKRYVLDCNTTGVDYAAFTLSYGSTSAPTDTFTDGTASTGTITVSSLNNLVAQAATNTITVSNLDLAGIAATNFISLSGLTNAQLLGQGATNQFTLAISTLGYAGLTLTINGEPLVAGVQWQPASTSTGTASNIQAAIAADTYLSSILVSSWTTVLSSGVVFATGTINLVNGALQNSWTMSTSSPTSISTASTNFTNGLNSVINQGHVDFFNGQSHVFLDQGVDWFIQATASATMANLATAMGQLNSSILSAVTTSSTTIFSTATFVGGYANSYQLTATPTSFFQVGGVAASTNPVNFTGGVDPALRNAFITLNGTKYRNGYEWFDMGTATGAAASIAAALTADPQSIVTASTTVGVSTVVFATATALGAIGNSYTLTASTSAIIIGSATFNNGFSSATITINGITLLEGTNWTAQTTTSGTAQSISNAIQANASLAAIISSTWTSAGVVTATATAAGANNYAWSTNNTSSIVLSSASGMTQGTASAVLTAKNALNIPGHGLGTGSEVLFGKTAGTPPGLLTVGTTFFAIIIDTNNIQLAATSTGAVAGLNVGITTQTVLGGGSFTLTPLVTSGNASWAWQFSNDNVTWYNTAIASTTFVSPYTSSTTAVDLGLQDYRYIGLNVIAPAQGGIVFTVKSNGKHSNP